MHCTARSKLPPPVVLQFDFRFGFYINTILFSLDLPGISRIVEDSWALFRIKGLASPKQLLEQGGCLVLLACAMGSFLDKPITEKSVDDVEGNGLRCGASEMQGWRVPMEVCLAVRATRPLLPAPPALS